MTAITQIADWINEEGRPIWWRQGLRLMLQGVNLDQGHYDLFYRIAKKEAGFLEDLPEFENYNLPVSSAGFEIEEKKVILCKLGPVDNVSSLAAKQVLNFSIDGMTVIYGDNGVGKSSYAKILKNACLTRGEKPNILGNIFDFDNKPCLSKICYQIGDEPEKEVHWEYQGNEISALKSIRIFDTQSACHYVEKEGELDYRPAGLHLLDELIKVCKYIKTQVEPKIAECSLQKNLPIIDENTIAGKFLKSISTSTTSIQLESNCITSDEILTLEKTQRELLELRTKTAAEIRKKLERKITSLKPLLNSFEKAASAITNDEEKVVMDLKSDLKSKFDAAEIARGKVFSELPLDGIGSKSWKVLWDAASNFIKTTNDEKAFPTVAGDYCPLCLQDVSDKASVRMTKFEEYIKDVTQKDHKTAENKLKKKLLVIENVSLVLEPYKAVIEELEENLPNIKDSIKEFLDQFSKRQSLLLTHNVEESEIETAPKYDRSIVDNIKKHIESIEKQVEALKDDKEVEKQYNAKMALEKELKAKKALTDGKLQIEAEVKRQKAYLAYGKIKNQTNPRLITQKSTEISNVYLTSSLKDYFKTELQQMGFNYYEVKANTRGSSGAQLFKLKLNDVGSTKVHTIASEGEQKCLALASVFAELKADARMSGVVFDDPVNSLDHKWRTKIASRLVMESLERQVIVFTHDIVFLKLLLESSETVDSSKINVVSLDRGRSVTGIVRSAPPWDALTTAKRIKYLKVLCRELRKVDQEGTETEYDQLAGSFYGYLREAWERLVEEKLLNKVVERFGRGVQTTRLKKLKDITDDDIELIDSAMGKCSALFKGHDTAPGVYSSMPLIEEIDTDIKTIKDFEQELSNNRKRG
jgi:energy-coupling factor transporter ATP-binding protein EcfA2